jgi:hypothetical protein
MTQSILVPLTDGDETMKESIHYIETVDLPPPPPGTRGGDVTQVAASFTSGQQGFVVNSQLAEFNSKVPQALRPTISYGLLLGQLAADKATAGGSDPWLWFTIYNSVMGKIGWGSMTGEIIQQTLSNVNTELHKAIIPVLTLALGPAATAGSILLSTLNGLQEMKADMPWLTLFQRKSRSVKGAKFGMSYVDAGDDGGALLKTVFFGVEAAQVITQVLFVKIATSGATVKSAVSELMLNGQTVADTKEALANKVAPFIVENIANIDI